MPDVQTVPALPWPTGDGGGTIKLSRQITESDLLLGVVQFTLENAGRVSVGSVVRDPYQQLLLRVDNTIFIISPIPHSTDTLTLTRDSETAAQNYSLIDVKLFSLIPEIDWAATGKYVALKPAPGYFSGKYVIGEIKKSEKTTDSIDVCTTGGDPNYIILCDSVGRLSTSQLYDANILSKIDSGYSGIAYSSGSAHSISAIETAGGVQGIVLP